MKTIVDIIKDEMANRQSCFVFPSEAAASQWALCACAFTGAGSVALNRFIAWDRFKEQAVPRESPARRPTSGVIRRLFAEDLAARNAAAAAAPAEGGGEALPFRVLIPQEYAREGRVFAPSLAALLPSLRFWRERMEERRLPWDEEDRDLALLEGEYRRFLDRFGFFEPSWTRPAPASPGGRYVIFCPELIEDFAEYEGFFREGAGVFVPVPLSAVWGEGEGVSLFHFPTARGELRAVVLEIQRLHREEGIPYEEMAVSVPGLEDAEAYLLREFALYDIPLRRRYGKPLGEYAAGRLFSLIQGCTAASFSFSSLKALLLNPSLPWSSPEKNGALIRFGIENNCVCAYQEGGRRKDIWEEAFAMKENAGDGKLRRYYRQLKRRIIALSGAKGFRELRDGYFAFRGGEEGFEGLLPPGEGAAEGDAVLGRCIEELSGLVQLEEACPGLGPPSPLGFFISVLKEKQYVPRQEGGGVHLFPYRVGAAAPFTCHFILNASGTAASVGWRSLKFLRRDKRERLGLLQQDREVSPEFFRAYGIGVATSPRLWFSASDRTFSGWAVPHSFFQGRVEEREGLPTAEDPFVEELRQWGPRDSPAGGEGKGAPVVRVQGEGFSRWRSFLPRPDALDLTRPPAAFPQGSATALLAERINRVQRARQIGEGEGPLYLKVSATDLEDFFTCSLFWLYKKVFALEPFSLEARLLDEVSRGLLYHRILEKLFARIRERDGVFREEHLSRYREWARACTEEAVRGEGAFKGPLAAPLVGAQAASMGRQVAALLDPEAAFFSGFAVAELEASLEVLWRGLLLKGTIDRVSVSPEGWPVIIDYKTRYIPSRAASVAAVDSHLEDFQIPFYITLFEEAARKGGRESLRAEGAVFVSILERRVSAVVGDFGGRKSLRREEYQETLDALEGFLFRFQRALEALDFSPVPFPAPQICAACDYRRICRTAFLSGGAL